MRSTLLVALCLLATLAYVLADASETCTPGQSYPHRDGCNTCTCPPSGKKSDPAPCTAKLCLRKRDTDGDSCVPGMTFPHHDGCNTCFCAKSGKKSQSACTEIGCGRDPNP